MEEAIKVLVQVAQLAQSKGLLSLEDAVVVLQAIKVLTPKEEEVLEE
jgi:flagellar motor component MotA